MFKFSAFVPICAPIDCPCSSASGCCASGLNDDADAEQNRQVDADAVSNHKFNGDAV